LTLKAYADKRNCGLLRDKIHSHIPVT